MLVRVLRAKPYIPGKVGDDIEVDPAQGHKWAGIGLVRVVRHDAGRTRSVMRRTPDSLKWKAKQDGENYSDPDDVTPGIIIP